jgi:hypothetical protein
MIDVFELLRRRLLAITRSSNKNVIRIFSEEMLESETAIDTIARELTEAITPPPRHDYEYDKDR